MRTKLEEMGERLLSRIVPRSTAKADHCYHYTICSGSACGSPSNPVNLRWRREYACCQVGSNPPSCSLYSQSCSCS